MLREIQARYPWEEVARNHWINQERRKKEQRSFAHIAWAEYQDLPPMLLPPV